MTDNLTKTILADFDTKFMNRGNYVYQVEIRDFLADSIQKVREETIEEIKEKGYERFDLYAFERDKWIIKVDAIYEFLASLKDRHSGKEGK